MLGEHNPLKLEDYLNRKHDRKIKNNLHLIKEEIWDILTKDNPKLSRKMYFIKVSKVPDHKLLQFKKEALKTDNFNKAFYSKVKGYNIETTDNKCW